MCNTNSNVQNVNVNVNRNSVLRASQLNLAGLSLGQNLSNQVQQNWQFPQSLLQVTSR